MRRAVAVYVVFALVTAVRGAECQSSFVIRGVRVFDGEGVSTDRSVFVRDGQIVQIGGPDQSVPAGTQVVDGHGRTLLPGLIDAHVHLTDDVTADLRQAASLGVTTVFDMWSGGERFAAIKRARAADEPHLADVRSAGTGATAPGGHPAQMGGPPFPAVLNAAQAAEFVDARIAEGSDYIKIIYDDLTSLGMQLPRLDLQTLRALVTATHARGKLAVVHALSEAQGREAIAAGADGLVHFFASDNVSSDFAAWMAQQRAFVVLTLSVLYGSCGRESAATVLADTLRAPYIRPAMRDMLARTFQRPPVACDRRSETIRQLAARGVPILAGTDSPAPGLTYGASLHGELALLVHAGLTPVQALKAATSAPARAFGLADRGAIRAGLRADLVLVNGDPTRDIGATRNIVMVWKRGVPVVRLRY